MRVKQESLYDSEATLRLVDRVLDDLNVAHCLHPVAGLLGYRTEQLGDEVETSDPSSATYLRAYWEVQDALEQLRDSHDTLRPVPGPRDAAGDSERVSQALAMMDQLQSAEDAPRRDEVHEALRQELTALAEQLRCRDAMSGRLHRTIDLLRDLEVRLARLSRVIHGGEGRWAM